MTNLIIIAVVIAVVALAGLYVYKAKKSGQKCVGCPHAKTCGANGSCSCSSKN